MLHGARARARARAIETTRIREDGHTASYQRDGEYCTIRMFVTGRASISRPWEGIRQRRDGKQDEDGIAEEGIVCVCVQVRLAYG